MTPIAVFLLPVLDLPSATLTLGAGSTMRREARRET